MASSEMIPVFVVAAPPRVRRRLRPAGRCILPLFLPTERGEVKERPDTPECLEPAPGREVGEKNTVVISQKNAETGHLSLVGRDTEVDVKVAVGRRDPWNDPSHAVLVSLDVRQGRTGH